MTGEHVWHLPLVKWWKVDAWLTTRPKRKTAKVKQMAVAFQHLSMGPKAGTNCGCCNNTSAIGNQPNGDQPITNRNKQARFRVRESEVNHLPCDCSTQWSPQTNDSAPGMSLMCSSLCLFWQGSLNYQPMHCSKKHPSKKWPYIYHASYFFDPPKLANLMTPVLNDQSKIPWFFQVKKLSSPGRVDVLAWLRPFTPCGKGRQRSCDFATKKSCKSEPGDPTFHWIHPGWLIGIQDPYIGFIKWSPYHPLNNQGYVHCSYGDGLENLWF